ncbi:MAG: glycoside hydrolase family 3 protein, partial [Bacteroidales bacterium]
EWGLIMRFLRTMRFPMNMTLAATNSEELLYRYGQTVARQCRRIGVNMNFSPVMDVNSNPLNPVISMRSYGEFKDRVSRLGIAFARGQESLGVLSSAKHFPGHGDTSDDSHKMLPTVDKPRAEIMELELFPFKRYIDAGLNGVMTAHLNMPALDSVSGLCSSLSYKIVTELLREQLGFKGLIITDALEMGGAMKYEKNALKALIAGNDILLMPSDLEGAINDISEAIECGELSETVVDEHCQRVLEYKYRLGLDRVEVLSTENLVEDLNSAEDVALCRELYRRSITLVADNRGILPFNSEDVTLLSLGTDENLTHTSLGQTKADKRIFNKFYHPKLVNRVVIDSTTKAIDWSTVAASKLVVEVFSDKDKYKDIIKQITDCDCKSGIVYIFYISPYKLDAFKGLIDIDSDAVVLAYEDSEYAQEFAQCAAIGEINMVGSLPISLGWK